MIGGRELVAAVVVLVGGGLWALVPDRQPSQGSLRDHSVIARWHLPPGRGLAAWVLVENRGPHTITLTGATVGRALPEDAELLGARARIGEVATIDDEYPGRPGPFFRLEGFEIPPRRGATIGFGLALRGEGLVKLEDARVTYEEDGVDYALEVRRTARICVAPTRRDC